jgi:hypothetical protein
MEKVAGSSSIELSLSSRFTPQERLAASRKALVRHMSRDARHDSRDDRDTPKNERLQHTSPPKTGSAQLVAPSPSQFRS